MARAGRRGGPPDLKGTLGTLLRTTINQVGAFTDVARRSALTQKQRLDGALLERRRRDALAELGEVLYELLKSGEIELDELPELVRAAEEIEELDRRIAEADAEGSRGPKRPVRLTRTEPEARARDAKPTERVWRPRQPEEPAPQRGGITFVEDEPGDEKLDEYMNEADVPERRRD